MCYLKKNHKNVSLDISSYKLLQKEYVGVLGLYKVEKDTNHNHECRIFVGNFKMAVKPEVVLSRFIISLLLPNRFS